MSPEELSIINQNNKQNRLIRILAIFTYSFFIGIPLVLYLLFQLINFSFGAMEIPDFFVFALSGLASITIGLIPGTVQLILSFRRFSKLNRLNKVFLFITMPFFLVGFLMALLLIIRLFGGNL